MEMMISRLQQVSRKSQGVNLHPNEETDMFVEVPSPTCLAELCAKSFVGYGPELKSTTTKLVCTHGHPPTVQQHISAELKSLVDGSVLQATVGSQTPSTYELSYTPTTSRIFVHV